MSRFTDCFAHVVGLEGGYVNDPHDPGGETIYGITRRDHPDLWANGRPTLEQAQERYRAEYWDACRCDSLPNPYDLIVFDAAVNQGPVQAVMMLQKALGLTTDGRVGPLTIAACQTAGKEGPALVLTERAMRYIGTRNFDRFGRGWLKRLFLVAEA